MRASAILLTTSESLAKNTLREIDRQIKTLVRQEIIQKSFDDYGEIIVCDNLRQALDFANELAPEHLELCVAEPLKYIGMVDNAGSVFLGNWSPEPLGDYYAGPNHVLPTSGTARFFSPLSVDSFVKKSSFIYYTPEELKKAKSFIFMEYFILAEGKLWDRMSAALCERARSGVEVKIIFDDFGNIKRFSAESLQTLRDAGVEVIVFNLSLIHI